MATSKPNIVFCHNDQMHHLASSRRGNKFVSTPGFDEIAADGCTFDRAISANPICSPARACWYTGRMSSENGVFWNGAFPCRQDLPDLGQLLGAAGYDCYYGGKWHVTGRTQAAFKLIYPIISVGERNDEALAATGEAFLKSYTGDKPFFLNLGFMNPHDCCYMSMATQADAFKTGMEKLIDPAELPPLPPNYDAAQPLPAAGKGWTPDQMRLYLYQYYRMCETADDAVSRVYRALKASPFFENTIFITGADHGEMMTEHNLFGKSVPWDASSRVPLIIVGKNRIAPGSTNSDWIQGVDISVTIADYAGTSIPNAKIGRSFRPRVESQSGPWHDYAVSESNMPDAMVAFRQKDSKSVFHLGGASRVEFYDIATDPWEMHDLAANGANPSGLDEHRAFLADYQGRVEYQPGYKAAIAAGHFNKNGMKPKGRKALGAPATSDA
jgi:arylsulfatase A-like enzyme